MVYFAERYRLGSELGSGGYGTVYAAHDDNTGRDVALKIFKAGVRPGLAFREAHLLTALEGPHILRMYDADVWNDIAHMSSAIAVAGNVERRVAGRGVNARHASLWVSHLLDGLDATHRSGLVHRDVKPSNVFLDSIEHARLGDFGTADALSAGSVAAEGDILVRAPEMWLTGRSDARGDIYSVGVTLWRSLTGRWPFEPETRMTAEEYGRWVVGGIQSRLRDVAPHVPRQLAAITETSLALDPDNRYQTAHEMAVALGRLAVPARWWERVEEHPGHQRCWVGPPTSGGGSPVAVCVVPAAGRDHEVLTTKQPSGHRVRDHCVVVNRRQLPVTLRRVFDNA